MEVNYFDIAWFSKTDGPGNRVVLYLQSCNLTCPWCHSPHSWGKESPILYNPNRCLKCYRCLDVCEKGVHSIKNGEHVLDRDKCIKCGKCIEGCPTSKYDSTSGALALPTRCADSLEVFNLLLPQLDVVKHHGGLTLSGGEALLQKEAVLEILKYAKSKNIHTAVETSLTLPTEIYKSVGDFVDCWLIGMRDIYLSDENKNEYSLLLENVKLIASLDKEVIVRYPIIKGITDSSIQQQEIMKFMGHREFKYIEILPCNKNMEHYYFLSGIEPRLNVDKVLPSEEELNSIAYAFSSQDFTVKIVR